MLARPAKVYDFTAFARRQPTTPPPGDRIDAQLQNHADAITAVQLAVENLIAAKAKVDDVEIKTLAAEIKAFAQAEFGDLTRSAGYVKALADQAQHQLKRVWAEADRARDVADRAEARLAAAVLDIQSRPSPAPQFSNDPNASQAMPLLGYGAGGFYASDDAGAAAVSADYAQVSIEWAEHMPDTIPPNILAINSISGEHWSSRWWALRAANAFGMLAWWYMGAWPGPPPTTPLTPTGDPIPPGGMYFDTELGIMLVWNGSSWVPLAQGAAKATTASLYYHATAGQTLFPLSVADRYGHTFAFNQTATEGLLGLVNGVRLEPTVDFTVDTVASSVAFLRPLSAGAVVAFDLLTPVAQLSPSGSVNTVLLSPLVPDGVKTVFNLFVASSGSPANVAKNEELLVSVDGVQQSPGAAYNASAGSITFVEAPRADALIFIVWFGPAVAGFSAPAPASLWSADDAAANGMTLSNGGLTVNITAASLVNQFQIIRNTISKSSGKVYIEVVMTSGSSTSFHIGNASSGVNINSYLGNSNYSFGANITSGAIFVSPGCTEIGAPITDPMTAGDVVMLAIDFASNLIWIGKNNVWYDSGGAPATAGSPLMSFVPATVGPLFFAMAFYNGAANMVWTLQATAASQKYAPPSGFSAWDGGVAPPPTSVWSSSDAAANGMTLSNGGKTVVAAAAGYQSVRGSISRTSGKYYVEFLTTTGSSLVERGANSDGAFGLANAGFVATSYLGSSNYSGGSFTAGASNFVSSGFTSNYVAGAITPLTGDVFAIAVDLTAGKYWLARNNVWYGGGAPATGANPMVSIAAPAAGLAYFPGLTLQGPNAGVYTLQSTAASQKYAPPSGFTPWG